MIKKLMTTSVLCLSLCFTATSTVQAEPSYSEKTTCYIFNKSNKLTSKGSCKIYSYYGAGGSETTITFKGKKYQYSDSESFDEKGNVVQPDSGYMRDVKGFKIIKTEAEARKLPFERTLFCNNSNKVDICYLATD